MSTYDRWADEKKKIGDNFDEWMLIMFGEEQHGVSPQALEWMHDAWQWSAIRALEMAAGIAAITYEGGCCGEDGSSGYDFNGDNTAEALHEIADALATAANTKTAEGEPT